jgi:predicted CoA-binding protein
VILMTTTPSDSLLRHVLNTVRTIAVVGASDKGERASHGVMAFLQNKGYPCIPVNPRLAGQRLLGETVHATLGDIAESVDMVDIFRNSSAAGPTADEAVAIGAKVIWMQLGVINEEAAERASRTGITIIMNRCPAIEWSRLFQPAAQKDLTP